MTAMAIGNIITAAAVFEIHNVTKPVASMNPNTIRRGLVPILDTIRNAIRRCRPHCSMHAAIHIPPKKRKFTGSRYCSTVMPIETFDKIGNVRRGMHAVAHSGTGSVIHQHDIKATVAAAQLASALKPDDLNPNPASRNRIGPSTSPTTCLRSVRANLFRDVGSPVTLAMRDSQKAIRSQ